MFNFKFSVQILNVGLQFREGSFTHAIEIVALKYNSVLFHIRNCGSVRINGIGAMEPIILTIYFFYILEI